MSADYPLTVPVVRIRRTVGPPDDLGNDTTLEETETVLVFAWAQVSPQEPVVYGHDRLQVDVQLYAGLGDFLPDDAVRLDAGPVFEVVGEAQNYDSNPWWKPGVEVVNLRRVQR